MKVIHRKRSITVLMVSLALISTCSNAEQVDALDDFAIEAGHVASAVKDTHVVSAQTSVDSVSRETASSTQDTHHDISANSHTNHKKNKKHHVVAALPAVTSPPSMTPPLATPHLAESKVEAINTARSEPNYALSQNAPSPDTADHSGETKEAKAPPAAQDAQEEVADDSFLGSLARHLKFANTQDESHTTSPNPTPSVSVGDNTSSMQSMWKTVEQVAMGAIGLLGVHYRFGGNTPENGLDCSGFVRYVFNQSLGIKLPRTSHEISQVGVKVDEHHLIPGDLVFFNTRNISFSHVGIYLGDNRFIHSPRTGKNVEIGRITDRYWSTRFNGGRRILGQLASRAQQP
jgi:cell wall-associated NlpC family hydrolase